MSVGSGVHGVPSIAALLGVGRAKQRISPSKQARMAGHRYASLSLLYCIRGSSFPVWGPMNICACANASYLEEEVMSEGLQNLPTLSLRVHFSLAASLPVRREYSTRATCCTRSQAGGDSGVSQEGYRLKSKYRWG
jgi:hypothetical protein